MPSECQQFEDYLLEDEESLSATQLEELSKHLNECPLCLEERELFLSSWDVLDQMEQMEPEILPSSMLRAKVWEKIREEEAQPSSLISADEVSDWKQMAKRVCAAAAALFLGFTLGRGLRSPAEVQPSALVAERAEQSQRLDPALIELASQEGFSVEIFPETTEFSPLDEEMISALAPSKEADEWLNKDQQVAVPLRFISQDGPSGGPR